MKSYFLKKIAWLIPLIVLLSACLNQPENRNTNELLNATLWIQHSAEYEALAIQTYRQARLMLDQALTDQNWTAALEQEAGYEDLPPAVILDVDETVLDNSPYEAMLIKTNAFYAPESWDAWCSKAAAEAVPGALDFCQYAVENGVTVFYITNRRDHQREWTRQNLKKLGFPLNNKLETILTRSDSGDKTERRAAVAQNYRILLMIGDNNGDFAGGFTKAAQQVREELVEKYADYWGSKWIVLPNPMYGDWEGALINYQYGASDKEKLAKKYEALIVE